MGGIMMKKILLLGFLFLALSAINAFPLVFDNYKLTSVIPKGKIIGDRSYEDKTIRIEFGDFTGDYPEFTLKNISNTPLTIIWDLCAFVDSTGRSQQVLRSNIPLLDRGKPIPPTMVIPKTFISEIIVPIESIYLDEKWIVNNSIPKEAGQTLTVVLTVEQEGRQTTYIFGFESVLGSGGVLVESGSFTMGDTWGDGYDNEKPTHEVNLTYDFYIGKYETTFNEYDAFCEATGKSSPDDENWGRGNRPVINVSWNDAIAYCNWLSEREGLPKAYDDDGRLLDATGKATDILERVPGFRLPTEAEWEYAARGGNKSKGHKYAGSDDVDEVAWYSENSGIKTHEVRKKAPNELGIHDMSGNVWEWCSDWYEEDYYGYSSNVNPYNTEGDYERVMRGGSVGLNETFARVTHRDYLEPSSAGNAVGFRICRTAKNQSELP